MRLTRTARRLLLASACALLAGTQAAPAFANSAAVDYFRNRADRTAVPALLSQDERAYYRDLFSAIDNRDWTKVQNLFTQKPDGPLHLEARAEFYTAPGSPRIDAAELTQWLAQGRTMPQAEQIARLAASRGAAGIPDIPGAQPLTSLPSTPKRVRPRETNDGTMPANIASAIQLRIKNDDPMGARALLDGIDWTLSDAARAEWRQKIAWSFYIENDDASAYAVGQLSGQANGPWAAEGWWTAGLAAWRLGDCTGAGEAFDKAAHRADNPELMSAARFLQARAASRCRPPEKAAGFNPTDLRGAYPRVQWVDSSQSALSGSTVGRREPGSSASQPAKTPLASRSIRHPCRTRFPGSTRWPLRNCSPSWRADTSNHDDKLS